MISQTQDQDGPHEIRRQNSDDLLKTTKVFHKGLNSKIKYPKNTIVTQRLDNEVEKIHRKLNLNKLQ